jgi:hypothetical protein
MRQWMNKLITRMNKIMETMVLNLILKTKMGPVMLLTAFLIKIKKLIISLLIVRMY